MFLLFFVKPRHPLDGHVVGFCRTGSEDDILGVCPDKISYMLQFGSDV